MTLKYSFFFIILIGQLLLSCSNEESASSTITSQGGIDSNNNTRAINASPGFDTTSTEIFLWERFKELDVNSIKLKYGRNSTSTVLSKKKYSHFFTPDTVGFYGMYYLVNARLEFKQHPYFAKLVVYASNTPWQFSDENEKLIEIISYNNFLPLLKEIGIGSSLNLITNALGEPDYLSDNFMFFRDKNNIVLTLRIKEGEVDAICFGRYKSLSWDILSSNIIDHI